MVQCTGKGCRSMYHMECVEPPLEVSTARKRPGGFLRLKQCLPPSLKLLP